MINGILVEATGVELITTLTARKLLILGSATRAKKAPLPNPLYVYCTRTFSHRDRLRGRHRPSIPQVCRPLRKELRLRNAEPKHSCQMMIRTNRTYCAAGSSPVAPANCGQQIHQDLSQAAFLMFSGASEQSWRSNLSRRYCSAPAGSL